VAEDEADWVRRDMPDLPTFLSRVRAKPGLWVGSKTILGLHMLLMGMGLAEDYHRIPKADRFGESELDGFETWVARRHNLRGLPSKSFGLADDLAGSDAAGFDLRFQ
jgi:hypothetical protein